MPKPDRHPHPELVEVRKSPLAGHGIFAIAPIPRGTRVLEYTGERITIAESEERDPVERVLLFDLGNGWVIDGDPWALAGYVNHSCEPNCHSEVIKGRLFVIADRDIAPGEEVTYDYMFDPDAEIFPCYCGSAKCRGTINVIPQKQPASPPEVDSPWNDAEHKVVKANEGPREKVKKGKQAA